MVKLEVKDFGAGRQVALGSSTGVFILNNTVNLVSYFPITYPFVNYEQRDGITGDRSSELVGIITDQNFPNVQVYQ